MASPRVDFGPELIMMSDRLNKHYQKKAFQWDSASRYTSRGLGRTNLTLVSSENNVPWQPKSGAASGSIRLRVTQTRKTGFIGDAFVFTAYHNMAFFYNVSVPFYGRKVNYLLILEQKYKREYLYDVSLSAASKFLNEIEGTWGKR